MLYFCHSASYLDKSPIPQYVMITSDGSALRDGQDGREFLGVYKLLANTTVNEGIITIFPMNPDHRP